MKKSLLIFFLCIIFIGVFQTKSKAVFENIENSIQIDCDIDSSNDISVKQTIIFFGNSNENLSSGITLEFPFEKIEFSNISFEKYRHNYSIVGNKIYIDLEATPLKFGEREKITVNYSLPQSINEIRNYKFLSFPSPTNGFKNYTIKINCEGEEFKEIYRSSSEANLKDSIDLIFKKNVQSRNIVEIVYPASSNEYLPIPSSSIYSQIESKSLTNSKEGFVDKNENFFLIPSSQEQKTEVSLLIDDTDNKFNKTNFLDLQAGDTKFNTLDEIITFVRNSYEPEFETNLETIDLNNIVGKKSLNNIEYVALTSSLMSKAEIEHRIVYGIVSHPNISKPSLGFWIETLQNNELIFIDPYFSEVLSINTNSIDIPRVSFGEFNQDNTEQLNKILNLNSFESISIYPDNTEFEDDQEISISYKNNNKIIFVNTSNKFARVTKSNNPQFTNSFNNLLIAPKTSVSKEFNLGKNAAKLEVDYIVGSSEYKNSISQNNFFLNIFDINVMILLFIISFILIVLFNIVLIIIRRSKIARKKRSNSRLFKNNVE